VTTPEARYQRWRLSALMVWTTIGGLILVAVALWGLGKRIFFLHDGRTKDLLEVIQAHQGLGGLYGPSEANQVVAQFNRLSEIDKQHVLNFLRSL